MSNDLRPVIYHLDDGKILRGLRIGDGPGKSSQLVVLLIGDGAESVIDKPDWFNSGYVAAYGGLVPECADEGTEPGQWIYAVAKMPQFVAIHLSDSMTPEFVACGITCAPSVKRTQRAAAVTCLECLRVAAMGEEAAKDKPAPAAPVTDADIEAAIDEYRDAVERGEYRQTPRANLKTLIARRVQQAATAAEEMARAVEFALEPGPLDGKEVAMTAEIRIAARALRQEKAERLRTALAAFRKAQGGA